MIPYSCECRACQQETTRAAGRIEKVLNRRDARMRQRSRERRPGQDDECTTAESRRHLRPKLGRTIAQFISSVRPSPPEERLTRPPEKSTEALRLKQTRSNDTILCEDLIEESIVTGTFERGDEAFRAMCTRETLAAMINGFDSVCAQHHGTTAKGRQISNATNQADAGTMFSPPLAASSPIKQEHNSRFVLDFTTCDKVRRPRNFASSFSHEEGIEAPGGTAAIMERYCVHFARCSSRLQNITLSRRCGKKVKETIAPCHRAHRTCSFYVCRR